MRHRAHSMLLVRQDLLDPGVSVMKYEGKASTYIPANRMGYWGGKDMRTRCTGCGKVWFPDEAGANRAAASARARGTAMHAYLGKCGHWHTSRTRK